MLLEASDPEIFAVKVEVDFYFEMEEVVRIPRWRNGNAHKSLQVIMTKNGRVF